jgi:hypothetical protein
MLCLVRGTCETVMSIGLKCTWANAIWWDGVYLLIWCLYSIWNIGFRKSNSISYIWLFCWHVWKVLNFSKMLTCFPFLNVCIISIMFYVLPCVLCLIYVVHRCKCLCYVWLHVYVRCIWFPMIGLFDCVYWKGQSKHFSLDTQLLSYHFFVVIVVNAFVCCSLILMLFLCFCLWIFLWFD